MYRGGEPTSFILNKVCKEYNNKTKHPRTTRFQLAECIHGLGKGSEGFLYLNTLQHSAFVIVESLLYLKYRMLFVFPNNMIQIKTQKLGYNTKR